MLFVPFTVPTFPATHHQTTHPAHQTHHQQLQATSQNPVQQPQQLNQLNQLSHLNHQGIVPATTNQPTVHSTSCSPQQQATTPNKQTTKLRPRSQPSSSLATCEAKTLIRHLSQSPRRTIFAFLGGGGKVARAKVEGAGSRLQMRVSAVAVFLAEGDSNSGGLSVDRARCSENGVVVGGNASGGAITVAWGGTDEGNSRLDHQRRSLLQSSNGDALGLSRLKRAASSVSSILPNKMEPSALLSHPLALASKLMSSLQHYTVQTLIPLLAVLALLSLLSKPALNHTSAHGASEAGGVGIDEE
uniref:Uncharacterized protein n=1 Tax=Vespula pensylvanica TaxID=30213 RepID=A0A834P7R6_VESPE|nr:hypothetical protein H0235_004675 [Vespula pensylvanica]